MRQTPEQFHDAAMLAALPSLIALAQDEGGKANDVAADCQLFADRLLAQRLPDPAPAQPAQHEQRTATGLPLGETTPWAEVRAELVGDAAKPDARAVVEELVKVASELECKVSCCAEPKCVAYRAALSRAREFLEKTK